MNRKQRRLNKKKSKNKNFEDTQKQALIAKGINTAYDLLQLGKLGEAEALYTGMQQHAPQDDRIFYGLGVVAHKRKHYDLAHKHMHEALKINPKSPEALVAMGYILMDLGKTEQAIEFCEKSLRLDRNENNTALYGTVLKLLGRFDESEQMFLESIALNPENVMAYKELISSKKMTPDNPAFVGLKALSGTEENLEDEDQTRLNFALGKAYFDFKDYGTSFTHYKKGNDLKNQQYKNGAQIIMPYINKLPELFSRDVIQKFDGMGNDTTAPIFIVGMPRSGTTLTEQILASHPKVHGAGELTAFLNCALYPDTPEKHGQIGGNDGGINKPYIKDLTGDDLNKLGQNYVNFALKSAPESASWVVDKMPFNFKRVGLIKMALPNAKIIYSRRSAMDIGMSIYRQLFQEDMYFAYDLIEIGKTIEACEMLMNHWIDVFGDDIFVSNYEDLVQNPEEQTRKLVEYCGLPWDDACLSPHKTERSVKTASFAQVRAPINTNRSKDGVGSKTA